MLKPHIPYIFTIFPTKHLPKKHNIVSSPGQSLAPARTTELLEARARLESGCQNGADLEEEWLRHMLGTLVNCRFVTEHVTISDSRLIVDIV